MERREFGQPLRHGCESTLVEGYAGDVLLDGAGGFKCLNLGVV